jgi:enolase
VGVASVPSGASTGENEAVELRDQDPKRYGGRGVRQAVAIVNEVIAPRLAGQDPTRQALIDGLLIELDGTPNKAKLGANAVLGVSQATACAAAKACGLPLYAYLGGAGARRLPIPMMNVLNGGKHADSSLDFQEFMIVPHGAPSFSEALRYGAETFQTLKGLLHAQGLSTSVGDEGGFAPQLQSNEAACELIVAAIEGAGYRPGRDISIALDPAASSFFEKGQYHLTRSGQGTKTSAEMTELYQSWLDQFPIMSLEDGLAENDWDGFRDQTAQLGDRVQIVGDDILVTNPRYIRRAIKEKICNAALIKLNQIGTVTETIEAVQLCRDAGWGFVISHRSGETEDPFMADFAVAMGGGQIKTGSLCRSERLAKYNRLLEIEDRLAGSAVFSG